MDAKKQGSKVNNKGLKLGGATEKFKTETRDIRNSDKGVRRRRGRRTIDLGLGGVKRI